MMEQLAAKSRLAQSERERKRIISERKKAHLSVMRQRRMEEPEGEPDAITAPIDFLSVITDLQRVNYNIESGVEMPVIEPEKDQFMPTIQKEVKLMMRLDHPNVIKTYQIFDSVEECYVVM